MTKLNLVLCDDNSADLESLRKSTDEYIKCRGFCGKTFCFSAPEEVLRFSDNIGDGNVTVYILDVIMPETDGIELGRRIREHDKYSAVIYISYSGEYSLDAFSVRAFSYLIKPFSQEKLFSELDECLGRIEPANNKAVQPTFPVKTANGTVALALSEIIAVEYLGHRLIFHLAKGGKVESVYRRQPFDIQAEELMQTGAFLKVSASYLVNYRNIKGIKTDKFVMCDGSQYKITRKYAGARKKYIDCELNGGVL
ncbi:MAG: LytTR family DNA-binding domain-containing protein [Oscillospiraceae bacterium]|nr:LytTR family DNA-binding domain-containing protein [Oscillospiraceae bacterium]